MKREGYRCRETSVSPLTLLIMDVSGIREDARESTTKDATQSFEKLVPVCVISEKFLLFNAPDNNVMKNSEGHQFSLDVACARGVAQENT